jgi:hypothetical protein
VGATDAEYLEKEFETVFGRNDLIKIPKYGTYLKLMINGITSEPFSGFILNKNMFNNVDSNNIVIN